MGSFKVIIFIIATLFLNIGFAQKDTSSVDVFVAPSTIKDGVKELYIKVCNENEPADYMVFNDSGKCVAGGRFYNEKNVIPLNEKFIKGKYSVVIYYCNYKFIKTFYKE